jgi:uncharacterized lipoprotein YmbA
MMSAGKQNPQAQSEKSPLIRRNLKTGIPRRNKAIPPEFRVEIDIPRFDGRLGGDVLLVARWTLYGRDEKPLLTKVSIITEASGGEGYEKLIGAQNRALQELSKEIVDAIQSNR